LDHDPPAATQWTPLGVLMLATGALTLIFTGSKETSDFWVDALKLWWLSVKDKHGHIKRLVIYLDNGPKNSGSRTQWLKRMVEFADWSGLEIRLVYYTLDEGEPACTTSQGEGPGKVNDHPPG
jgi:Rhodopirellula transposase DDE domain